MKKQITTLSFISLLLTSLCVFSADDSWTRSYALESSGQYIDAAKSIEKFLKQIPSNEFAEMRSGWLYYLAGNYSRSIKHYQTAIKINNQSIEARLGLTLPLMAQARWREAANESQSVIKQSKWNYYAHIRLMACEEALKQWDTLLKHANEAKIRYPGDATILVYLARAYKQTMNKSKMKDTYNQVLIRVPGHIEASRNLVD